MNLQESANKITNKISTTKALVEFVVVALILFAIGYSIHCHITTLLNESIEKSVSRHVGTISHSISREFEKELNEMHLGAAMVEDNQVTVSNLIKISNAFEKRTDKSGMLKRDGRPVDEVSKALPQHEFHELEDVFGGEDVITYHKGQGMIFAVPVEIDGEICLFYHQYDDKEIPKLFSVISYDGEGRVTLGYKTGEWTEISLGENAGKFYDELSTKPGFKEAFFKVINPELLRAEGRVIQQFEFDGEAYIAFSSYVYNRDFAIFGLVKHEAVSAGIDYIHVVMLGVSCLLFLVIIMFGRYKWKITENKMLKQENYLAVKASQTKSEFLSNMSHEIRTPITQF